MLPIAWLKPDKWNCQVFSFSPVLLRNLELASLFLRRRLHLSHHSPVDNARMPLMVAGVAVAAGRSGTGYRMRMTTRRARTPGSVRCLVDVCGWGQATAHVRTSAASLLRHGTAWRRVHVHPTLHRVWNIQERQTMRIRKDGEWMIVTRRRNDE